MTGAEWREIRYGNEGGGVVVRGQEEGVGYMGVGVCACGGGEGVKKMGRDRSWESGTPCSANNPPPPFDHFLRIEN